MLHVKPHIGPTRIYERPRRLRDRLREALFNALTFCALALGGQTVAGTPFQGFDNGQSTTSVYFTITPTGSYTTGGDTLDLTQLKDILKSDYPPLQVYLMSQASGGNSGWWYNYRPGTTLANGKMQVFGTGASSGASHQELANATAYNSTSPSIAADVIVGCAICVRL
jgi:hypothetical protein